MLTDADRELVAAAVDGELTPATEPAFRALVAHSAEALALFHTLTVHARRLAALPRCPAPPTLLPAVLAGVRDLPRAVPSQLAPATRRTAASRWLMPASAAGLFFAAAAGSFWLASREFRPAQTEFAGPPVAVRPDSVPVPLPPPIAVVPPEVAPLPREVPPAREPAALAAAVEAAPMPRVQADPKVLGGSPFGVPPAFAVVEARVPILTTVAEFDRPDVRAKLLTELGRDPVYRLDLFVRDTSRAADLFQAAARSVEVTLVTDAALADRLRKKQPAAWAVYTEALTADDIVKLCDALAAQARAAGTTFGAAHLHPAGPSDAREFREVIGVERGLWKRPRASAQPVAVDTVDQVTAAVRKAALVIPFPPAGQRTNPLLSAEVKAFWQKAGEPWANAVPLLIVVRPQG